MILDANVAVSLGQATASYLTHWCVTMNSINFCFASKDMNRKNSSIEKLRSSFLEITKIENGFDAKLS